MVTPIPVPSDGARSGVKNQTTFYETVKDNQRRLDTLERSSPLRNASVGAGGITFYDGGAIKFLQDAEDVTPGSINGDSEENRLIFAAPYDGEAPTQTFLALYGVKEGVPDNARAVLASSGNVIMAHLDSDGQTKSFVAVTDTDDVALRGHTILNVLDPADGSQLFIIEGLRTSVASANLTIDAAGDVRQSTSSLRYKDNVEDVVIDPGDVLRLRGRTFTAIDSDDTTRHAGFIAEELDELPTMRQFVNYDDQGRPDSISYDRLTVAVVEVLKDQQTKLAEMSDLLTRSVDLLSVLTESNALLTRRVETLQTQPRKVQ